ncbi:MAG: DUF6029 family protein [Candidatus Marinimicrobia bacterium]|nr:DUF6029 family protein [Candidatus Neomarinimicrobiota bacterium]MCF7850787.1 DUF6029 family protein [Candidatus Neomarinimicrobiota bacterium]MCF7904803.1 DUF6029 family protein [Candidatus Neomarinimicrobiota bacterium]
MPTLTLAKNLSWNYGIQTNYGKGQQLGLDYDYIENFFSTSVQSGPWYFDLNLEYSAPPEYGYEFTGVENVLLRYSADTWRVETGNLSAVFGRGLALNLYKDQVIDFDNQVLGFRFHSSILDEHELDFIAGINNNYRFYSPSSELREPDGEADYTLAGVQATINSESGSLSANPYFIGSQMNSDYARYTMDTNTGSIYRDTLKQTQHTLQAGWGQTVYGDRWDIFLEYNRSWKAFDEPFLDQEFEQTTYGVILTNRDVEYERQGQAFNLQVNWFPEWGTLMFDYRRYLNGPELIADKRNPLLLGQKALPWQMGPTGVRQHDISLLANVTHPVDYGDELGWTLELRKYFGYSWGVVLNASHISQSRDNRYMSMDAGYLPSTDESQNPWQEYFAELEYTGDRLSQRMLVAFTRSVLSGANSAEISDHYTLVPAYLSWVANSDLVLSSVVEIQQTKVYGMTYDGQTQAGHSYSSYHFIASADIKRNYSLALVWDTSDDPNLIAGVNDMQHWVSGEISVKPLDGLWIRGSYGKEKGGVRCTGGVCRILNPFAGFRLTMEWRI